MIGDSITDCGRSHHAGDGIDESLGDGYVNMINGLLIAAIPEYHIKIINKGISGNTIRDLDLHWDQEIIALEPDWVSIMIGINDVWQHFDPWTGMGSLITPAEYENMLEKLIDRTKPKIEGLVLITPYYLQPDRNDPMRRLMDQFGDIVRFLAEKHQSVLVDTQKAFDLVMHTVDPLSLAQDRVHVNLTGRMILARNFLRAVGYAW